MIPLGVSVISPFENLPLLSSQVGVSTSHLAVLYVTF